MDGYESHLSVQFVRYCEMEKIILLRLPPHLTHFLQPLDVVIFQQWKHWHTEAIDHAVRHGVGDFCYNPHRYDPNYETSITAKIEPHG